MTAPDIVVTGAGRMGRDMALSFACSGHAVILADSEDRPGSDFADLVSSVRNELSAKLDFLGGVKVISTKDAVAIGERVTVRPRDACGDALASALFVFEAVSEVLAIKESTYRWINQFTSPGTIISSTTSTMSPDTLAGFVNESASFCNAHWLNPAYLMPLVEVCPAEKTAEGTVTALTDLLEEMGKLPVVCKSSPGFIVSRIQALLLSEAARLVEEGVASPGDIDKAIRVGFGVRYASLGALEFIDWGGGDILYHASNYLADNIDHDRFSVPEIVKHNMACDLNGLRDRQGFYDYREVDIENYRAVKLAGLVDLLQHLELMPISAD